MAKVRGTRGYSSYRGRRNGKGLLAAVLALVLIAACGFLFAQRYIVYEADGSFRFELPWKKPQTTAPAQNGGAAPEGGDAADAPDDTELVIEPPEVTDIHAVELDASILTGGWESALDTLDEGTNAVAIRLKEASGRLLYDSSVQGAIDCGAVTGGSVARSAIAGITGSDYYTIARISTLHDSLYAYAHMTDAAVCQLTGYVWYDTYSTHWLAPEKEGARQYVTDIVTECASLGFDELLLDDFHYPCDGRMSRIKTDERTMTQQAALALLADDIRDALKKSDYAGRLSVSVDADIVLAGSEERTGIVMSELAEKFDRVYVPVTPEQLDAVTAAMSAYDTEFVPIVGEAAESGSYLVVK